MIKDLSIVILFFIYSARAGIAVTFLIFTEKYDKETSLWISTVITSFTPKFSIT